MAVYANDAKNSFSNIQGKGMRAIQMPPSSMPAGPSSTYIPPVPESSMPRGPSSTYIPPVPESSMPKGPTSSIVPGQAGRATFPVTAPKGTVPAVAPAAPAPAAQGRMARAGAAIRGGVTAGAATIRAAAPTGAALGAAALPAVAGAGMNFVQRAYDAANPEAPFVAPAAQPGEIPVDPNIRAPAYVASHPLGFGPDNEFTRNLANTMNALGPGNLLGSLAAFRAAGQGMRAKTAADIVRESVPAIGRAPAAANAANEAARALNAARSMQQVVLGAQAANGMAAPTEVAPVPTAAIDPNYGHEGMREVPGPIDGKVTRIGNSFSGNNVKEGFEYVDGRPHTGTVSSLDTSEGHRQNLMELQRLRAERAEREATQGGGLIGIGGSTGIVGKAARQRMLLDSQQKIADEGNAVTMRGHDMTQQNNLIQRQIALGQRQYERMKDDRAYQLDVAKFGQSQAGSNRAARADDEKSWQTMAENRFRTTDYKGNSAPDHAKIAEFNRAVDTTLPSLVKMLQATGSPEALKKAQEISARGKAALGTEDHDMLQRLFDKRGVSRNTAGYLPGKSRHIESDDLTGYLSVGKDTGTLDNEVDVTRNGARIARDKLLYGPDGNVFLPNLKPANTNLTTIR